MRVDSLLRNLDEKTSKFRTLWLLPFLLVPLAVHFAAPIWDIDVWFHLATGKVITHSRALLAGDPFTFIAAAEMDPERSFLLNSYWLAQILMYASYMLGGLSGLIAVKIVVLLTIPLLLFLQGQQRGHDKWVTILLMSLCGWQTFSFTAERPQILSMLFFVILMWLLSVIGYAGQNSTSARCKYNATAALFLPLLMVVWANCHPGFMLGSAVLVIYLTSEFVMWLLKKDSVATKPLLKVMVIVLVALAVTGINPNHFATYLELFRGEGTDMQSRTTEYLSPLILWSQYGIVVTPFFLYLSLFVVTCARCFRRLNPTFALISLLLATISLMHYRYIPYFVFGTAAELGALLTAVIASRQNLRRVAVVLATFSILLLWYGGVRALPRAYAAISAPVNTDQFPVAAAGFMELERPSGKFFNHFNWGGYLAWRLYPGYRIFIDGRCLSATAFTDFTRILWTEEWKNILHRHRVNMIIMPTVDDFTGELHQLVNFIAQDSEWHIVYCDETAFIAVDESANLDLIARKDIPKMELYRQAVIQAEKLVQKGLDNAEVWQTLATAYGHVGDLEKSVEARNMAVQRSR